MGSKALTLMLAMVLLGVGATAWAGEEPKVYLRISGEHSTQNMHKNLHVPFFTKELVERSGGTIRFDLKTRDALALAPGEDVRLVRMGVFDLATGALSYLAGEDPVYEGMDLPGLTLDIATQRKVAEAYKPVVAKRLEKSNLKLLGFYSIGLEVWYCRVPIEGLAGVAGKRVRVYNQTMADFVRAAGGSSVNITFAEVVPAMQRGVAECALTGTSSGNTTRWWEVMPYLFIVPMGWATSYWVANVDTWSRLDPGTRDFLTKAFAELEDRQWALCERDIQDGINCNLGKDCKDGVKADPPMKLIPITEKDRIIQRKIMEGTVIPGWAKRCGKECAEDWNNTVGRVVGMSAPTN